MDLILNKRKSILNMIQLVSLISYIFFAFKGNQGMSNVLSPLLLILSAILIHVNTIDERVNKKYWNLLKIMILTWACIDLLWVLDYNVLRGDPENNPIYDYLYFIPNVILVFTCSLYFYRNLRKWHFVQLMADVGLLSFLLYLLVSNSLFFKMNEIEMVFGDFIFTAAYAITDIFVLSLMIPMALAKRSYKINSILKLIFVAFVLYACADFLYLYMVYYDFYVPNNLSDVLFMIAFTLMGFASNFKKTVSDLIDVAEQYEILELQNKKYTMKWIVVLPIVFYILRLIAFEVVIKVAFLIGFHFIMSNYFDKTRMIERLLDKEKRQNELLEMKVKERTLELEKSNKSLKYVANFDALTALPNRRSFISKVDYLISSKIPFAVYHVNLDRFKLINDIHGHEMGDKVLKLLSQFLMEWQKETTTIARIGGDEFGVLTTGDLATDGLRRFSNEITELFTKLISVDSYAFTIGVSVGVTKYPDDSIDRVQLLKYASIAMIQAKHLTFGEKVVYYKSHLSERIEREHRVELMLSNADFDREFNLNYQPQIEIGSGKLIGVEALLRWTNPELGRVSPGEFIPIAESSDMIIDIGKWVLNEGLKQLKIWNDAFDPHIKMGINISPLQFDSYDFLGFIVKCINETEVNPKNIDFEITENSAMNSNIVMEEIFSVITDLGIQISIDDFGTGYSSLSYIKQYDIDRLKIAKELIDNIGSDHNDRLIIKAIIMMAKGMGLLTIAEGVETAEQLEYLKLVGCDEIQGYYFSEPLSAATFEEKYFNN